MLKVLAGRHLVVVDDTAIIKLGIEQALREAGATIERSFENGADAAILDIWLGKGTASLSIAQALADRTVLLAGGTTDAVPAPTEEPVLVP